MTSDRAPAESVLLRAVAAYAGMSQQAVLELASIPGDDAPAGPEDVLAAVEDITRRLELAPIEYELKESLLVELTPLKSNPPRAGSTEVDELRRLVRQLPVSIVEIQREPVALPAMSGPQHEAWEVVLGLENSSTQHWCLIGGQMVTLLCAEHDLPIHRATDDADVVTGVWTNRDDHLHASLFLRENGFVEDQTHDGYGYRFRRGEAVIDLLLPEHSSTQHRSPRTVSARPGIEVDGGNQALIRAEKVPVRLGDLVGHVRRPNVLGALVAKAAAVQADTRDTDRHRDDIAALGQIAYNQQMFRALSRASKPHDRSRLRYALETMPATHSSWRLIADPQPVREALVRLAGR